MYNGYVQPRPMCAQYDYAVATIRKFWAVRQRSRRSSLSDCFVSSLAAAYSEVPNMGTRREIST